MSKKKTTTQKNLFGNLVKEELFMIRTFEIEEKISSSKNPTKFVHDFWEERAEKYLKADNLAGALVCYNTLIENSGFTSPYILKKGTLLVNMRLYEEAITTLKNLYGCEGHDTIWAPAQLQMARAAALQGKKEAMIDYLTKAVKTTLFFERYSPYKFKHFLIDDIKKTMEFDPYRDLTEFKSIYKIKDEEYGEYEK